MYRAVMMGFNKNNMPKDDPQEKAKHRRELLRKAAKRSKDREKQFNTTSIFTNEVKKLRQQISKYEKRVRLVQFENNRLHKKLKAVKQENYYLKKKNKEIRLNNKQAKQDNNLLKEEFQKKFDELNSKNSREEKLNTWLDQNNINDVKELQKYVNNLTDQYELVSLLFQVQAEKNKDLFGNLMDQLQNNRKLQKEIDHQNRQLKVLNKEKEEVYKKISLQKGKNKELKEYINQQIHLQNAMPNSLIDLLINRCSEKNFSCYDNLDNLIRKYQSVLDNLVHQQQNNDYRYGYIKSTDKQWLLHDVNTDNDISVGVNSHLLQSPHLITGATVRCRKTNDSWEVEKLYYLPDKVNKTARTKHKHKKSVEHVHNDREIIITNLNELKWAMQKRILVVGNKFSSGFLDELKKYCHVQVMDAYEDGMQQIFKAMHKSDYVFLLIGSVPHAITDYTKNTDDLNENSQKIQIFDTPAKYDGVIRLHYLFSNSR